MRHGRSIRGTLASDHVRGRSWNWVRRIVRWTSCIWMPGQSGPRGRLLMVSDCRQRRAGERGGKKRRQGSVLPSRFDDRVYPDTRPADLDRIMREAESSVMTEPDPEEWYHVGALMAYCARKMRHYVC